MRAGHDVDVLVAGGSTVGLFTALLLARRDVSVRIVERRATPPVHPRAMGIGPRTVEVLRELGLAEAVDAECVDMTGSALQMFSAPTLAAADLPALAATAPPSRNVFARTTPQTLRGTCPQGRLDIVLRKAAVDAGVQVDTGTELLGLHSADEGVQALVRDVAGTGPVRARYVVGADGARSTVRTALGIGTSGPGPLGPPLISVLFRADLRSLTRGHMWVMADLTVADAPGGLLPVDGEQQWIYHFRYDPARGEALADFTDLRCAERIRHAVGVPGLDVEILSILPWQPQATVADRFGCGRVHLVGDAAHVVPPPGAFGMNTGVADAHNLAWKLALVIQGNAAPALLETYEAERRPVALSTVQQAMLRLHDPSLHWDQGPQAASRRAEAGALNAPVVHLGYRYSSDAIDGEQLALPSTEDLEQDLDGTPGSRLPHAWLQRGGATVSTLDVLQSRFTLLAGPDATVPVLDRADLGPSGLDLHVDIDTLWPRLLGLAPDGAVLVRPDGFIAWRCRRQAGAAVIPLGQLLALP